MSPKTEQVEWTCGVCGGEYAGHPDAIASEKRSHGKDTCGKHTEQQRVSLNVINHIRAKGEQGETFAEALERLLLG